MRTFASAAVVSWLLLLAVVLPLGAQSLADVARKEEERRKSVAEPAKVYTNKDLKGQPPSATTPSVSEPAASADSNAADQDKDTAKDKAPATGDAKDKEPAKDKAYWTGRLKALQDQLDRDQTYADALQSRINGLQAQFVNRDDPAERSVIERDRNKALTELDRLKQELPKDKKALADFLEEARRAGVPPGWLR
jgi:hypothetical protein